MGPGYLTENYHHTHQNLNLILMRVTLNTFIHNVCHTPVLCSGKQHHDKVFVIWFRVYKTKKCLQVTALDHGTYR